MKYELSYEDNGFVVNYTICDSFADGIIEIRLVDMDDSDIEYKVDVNVDIFKKLEKLMSIKEQQ